MEDGLGAVAVVGIEIPDGDTGDAAGAGGKGGDGDVVEIAKTHRLGGRRMMTGRAHEGEGAFAGEGEFGGGQGRH